LNKLFNAHKLLSSILEFERFSRSQEAIMTDNQLNKKTIRSSLEDNVIIVSPIVALVDHVKYFCEYRKLNLWKVDPDSPDFISVPYKIGIVDKYFMDPQIWSNWIEFLRETKGKRNEHVLIIIILPPPFSDYAVEQVMEEFENAHQWVGFVFGPDGDQVVKIMEDWLNKGIILPPGFYEGVTSHIVQTQIGKPNLVAFRERIEELMNRFTVDDTKQKVSLDFYYKFRIQAKWLLAKYLGQYHLYTKELNTLFEKDVDKFGVGEYLLAARGILEALAEDLTNGLVELREGS
jgi:hypothetical protein